jgi:hypothetical protein
MPCKWAENYANQDYVGHRETPLSGLNCDLDRCNHREMKWQRPGLTLTQDDRRKRNDLICKLDKKGERVEDIAKMAWLTISQINRILRKAKTHKNPRLIDT